MSEDEKKYSEDLSSLSIDALREKIEANTSRIESNEQRITNLKLEKDLEARIAEQAEIIHKLKSELAELDEEFAEIFEKEENRIL